MKWIYLLLFGAINSAAIAQDEQQAIQQWQSSHPTTLFVSSERYSSLSEKEQQLLGSNVLIYNDNITLAAIEQHDAQSKSTPNDSNKPGKAEDLAIVKNWLAFNSDVKLLPRSQFDAADATRQQAYLDNPRCLILLGEQLTAKDVQLLED